MIRNIKHNHLRNTHRRGTILPALVMGMVCMICCLALVLDQLWLDAAETELQTAAEAAAFAAAGELVHDDQLCEDANHQDRIEFARLQAERVAHRNYVAGESVSLDMSPEGDCRFGQLVADPQTGDARFLLTDLQPRTVRIRCCRQRSRGNPLAMLFRGITGVGTGNAHSIAEVTASNQILGVRPFGRIPVPALPLAILKNDPSGLRTDTWDHQIIGRNGSDEYRFNAETGQVEEGSDGIPEIHLNSKGPEQTATDTNLQIVDLQTDFQTDDLLDQMKRGWDEEDLAEFDGELLFHTGAIWLTSLAQVDWDHADGLERLIGKPRICLLYTEVIPAGDRGYGKTKAVDFVAGRIMSVRCTEENQHTVVFQPTVITTKTAVLASSLIDVDRLTDTERKLLENPFIYQLHLTR